MIEPVWPYPSDIGSLYPYASYFSEFLTNISFLCKYIFQNKTKQKNKHIDSIDLIVLYLFTLSSIDLMATYCRYKQVSLYLISGFEKETNNNKHAKKILVKLQKRNFCAFLCNFVLIFGSITLGNFRMSEHFYIHWIAVVIFIIFSIIYMFMMVMIIN